MVDIGYETRMVSNGTVGQRSLLQEVIGMDQSVFLNSSNHEKYNGCLPAARCIQYFNKAIKEICKKIGLTEPVIYEEEQAGEVVMVKKKKYEMISSHTARRTFATSSMRRNNVSTSKIRKCTGHKSTACFDRYDRMMLTDNALSLAGNGYLS